MGGIRASGGSGLIVEVLLSSRGKGQVATLRIGIDGRILMHYEMRGFARYTVELFRAMKELAGDAIELISFSPGPLAPEFLSVLESVETVELPYVFRVDPRIKLVYTVTRTPPAPADTDKYHS